MGLKGHHLAHATETVMVTINATVLIMQVNALRSLDEKDNSKLKIKNLIFIHRSKTLL